MNSLSIKAALMGVLGLLGLMIAGLGYLSVTRLAAINDNVGNYANTVVPAVSLLGAIDAYIAELRYLQAEHLMSKEAGEMAEKEKELAEIETSLNENLNAYAQLS